MHNFLNVNESCISIERYFVKIMARRSGSFNLVHENQCAMAQNPLGFESTVTTMMLSNARR